MKTKIFIIYPIHLYNDVSEIDKWIRTNMKDKCKIVMIEDSHYFTEYRYHNLKLIYHRATMKYYYDTTLKKISTKYKIPIEYIEIGDSDKFYKDNKNEMITIYECCSNKLEERIKREIDKIEIIENKNFLCRKRELDIIKRSIYRNGRYNHRKFYKYQRIKLDILMRKGEPIGGEWSYDKYNRLPIPKDMKFKSVEKEYPKNKDKYYDEAKEYIRKIGIENYGDTVNTIYPISHNEAKGWFRKFIRDRLMNYGKYEDAITDKDPFVFHSVISPMMNIGILTDKDVIGIWKDNERRGLMKGITIENREGFIRQIIGWRNYVWVIYLLEGREMIKTNKLKAVRRINNKKWWNQDKKEPSNTIPIISKTIDKINRYGYCHHIERLMILGSFMMMIGIRPDDVYKQFMEWTIDAYEWVMIPNVYGMSQHTCGNLMMTRPYFSSSNYIRRMSNENGGEWESRWNGVYYYYIERNKKYLVKNYAIANMVKQWEKKTRKEKEEEIRIGKEVIREYTK